MTESEELIFSADAVGETIIAPEEVCSECRSGLKIIGKRPI